ncbi:MAG TPA: DUF2007 domain-containing protein [Pedobacter sp.]|nr:DUF2007 domain-containing protein [Pedobacter sp.]
MKDQNDVKLVAVFEGEPWQVTMMQNVLVENDIPAFVKNNLMGSIEPWVLTSGGLNPAQLMVSEQQEAAAIQLIEEFNNAGELDE